MRVVAEYIWTLIKLEEASIWLLCRGAEGRTIVHYRICLYIGTGIGWHSRTEPGPRDWRSEFWSQTGIKDRILGNCYKMNWEGTEKNVQGQAGKFGKNEKEGGW